MKRRSFRARLVRTSVWITLTLFALFATGAISLTVLWRRGVIQPWLTSWAEEKLVETYIERVKKDLPFEVVRVEVTRDWATWLTGRLPKVSLDLRKDDWKAHLEGPLTYPAANRTLLSRVLKIWLDSILGRKPQLQVSDAEDIRIEYSPEILITPPGQPSPLPSVSSHLWIDVKPQFESIRRIGAEFSARKWASAGLNLDSPKLVANWDSDQVQVQVNALSLEWNEKSPQGEKTLQVQTPRIELEGQMPLKPFSIGTNARLKWSSGGAETLWLDQYFSAPAAALTGEARLTLRHPQNPKKKPIADFPWLEKATLALGPEPARPVRIDARFVSPARGEQQILLDLKTQALELRPFLSALLQATQNSGASFAGLQPLREMEFKSGTLASQGQARIRISPKTELLSWQGKLDLDHLGLTWNQQSLALRDARARLRKDQIIEGKLSIGRFGYRHWIGSLAETPVQVELQGPRRITFGEKGKSLDAKIEGLPLRLSPILGHWGGNDGYELAVQVKLDPTPIERLAQGLCILKGAHLPPASLRADFTSIDFSPGAVDFQGEARADLFEGFIQASEIGLYDFGTEVPEIDFTTEMRGVRLDQLGEWLGFGEMDGLLEGHARDVVFQSWLPTQFDFRFEVLPFHRKKVVFSPDAMKNVMRLFAAEGADSLPKAADWLAFGWPSRVFGGYDVYYAGLQLNSHEGLIAVETLDPPSSEDSQWFGGRKQKHFILYGPRFKMPLVTQHYPLVVDATAMANTLRRVLLQLQHIAEQKRLEKSKEKSDGKGESNASPDDHLSCLPDGF